jgi:hypothetical protein
VYQNQCFPGVLVSGGNRGILSNVFNKFTKEYYTLFLYLETRDTQKENVRKHGVEMKGSESDIL